jgi:hypothetical protein
MDLVGRECFCAVSSDNTRNTRVARQILADTVRTMFNLPDPNHHLNRAILDVVGLSYFVKVGHPFSLCAVVNFNVCHR